MNLVEQLFPITQNIGGDAVVAIRSAVVNISGYPQTAELMAILEKQHSI